MTRGFSLVEVMVALFIFGLITAAAVTVLGATLTAKDAIGARDDRLRDLQLTRSLLRADLAQIALRPVRDPGGRPLTGGLRGGEAAPGAELLSLVRRGWENPGAIEARGSLQWVDYALDQGRLIRRSRSRLDPVDATPLNERVLIDGVEELRLSFFFGGRWSDLWLADGPNTDLLPGMVRVEMTLAGIGTVEQLFLTPGAGQ